MQAVDWEKKLVEEMYDTARYLTRIDVVVSQFLTSNMSKDDLEALGRLLRDIRFDAELDYGNLTVHHSECDCLCNCHLCQNGAAS